MIDYVSIFILFQRFLKPFYITDHLKSKTKIVKPLTTQISCGAHWSSFLPVCFCSSLKLNRPLLLLNLHKPTILKLKMYVNTISWLLYYSYLICMCLLIGWLMSVLFVKYIYLHLGVLLNQPMTPGRPLGIFHGPPVVQSLRTTVPFLRFHFNFFLAHTAGNVLEL